MKILVTGDRGFIGTHLTQSLITNAHEVVPYDLKNGHDIMVLSDLTEATRGCEAVIHLAAEKSVPRSWDAPKVFFKTNIQGTFNVLKASMLCNVRRVVLASSSSVAGGLSPYAVSKGAMESLALMYWNVHGLETACLRLFNVFGPGQSCDGAYAAVIPRFAEALRENRQPIIYGDGAQSRDFTYVENVVEAFRLALMAEKVSGVIVDIGTGHPHTVLELLSTMCDLLQLPMAMPTFAPARPGEMRDSCADLGLAQEWLGYAPRIAFREGLERTLHV